MQVVELDERLVERPRAEDHLERARVAVVEEDAQARGEPLLRDARADPRDLQLARERRGARPRSFAGLQLERAEPGARRRERESSA